VIAAQVGSPELLLGVWLLAGVISLLGTLSNAELAAMMPQTGGQYLFLQRAYGPFVAFLYGWALFAVIQSGSIAAVSYVFAEYATQFVNLPPATGPLAGFSVHLPFIGDIAPLKDFGPKSLGAGVIVTLTMVNYAGVRFGGVVQNIFSVAKMSAMLGLALAVMLAPGVGQMARSKLVAADVAERCFAGGGRWIATAVMLSTFGATNAIILTSARVYFSMGRCGMFPASLGVAHPRFHTPAASLLVQAGWS